MPTGKISLCIERETLIILTMYICGIIVFRMPWEGCARVESISLNVFWCRSSPRAHVTQVVCVSLRHLEDSRKISSQHPVWSQPNAWKKKTDLSMLLCWPLENLLAGETRDWFWGKNHHPPLPQVSWKSVEPLINLLSPSHSEAGTSLSIYCYKFHKFFSLFHWWNL